MRLSITYQTDENYSFIAQKPIGFDWLFYTRGECLTRQLAVAQQTNNFYIVCY